jgi:hypothetical protein
MNEHLKEVLALLKVCLRPPLLPYILALCLLAFLMGWIVQTHLHH